MDPKTQAQHSLAAARLAGTVPEPGQVYRHYKGGLYTIVRVSIDEGGLAPLVTYHSNARGTDWTRTLADFAEDVGGRPRFVRERD